MQEHPVPQNVTGYEFHLIGQMTLKQFLEVAGGVLLAVLINWTNLPQIIKYPLMGIAGLTGLALAFIPLEGRPLDRWFFAFIKSIYQPTMFFWKKTNATPPVFTYTPPSHLDTTPQVDYRPIRESRVQEYLTTIPQTSAPEDVEESKRADAMLALFTQNAPLPPSGPPRIIEMNVEAPTPPTPATPQNQSNTQGADIKFTPITSVGYTKHEGIEKLEEVKAPTAQISGEFTVVKPTQASSTPSATFSPVNTLTKLPFPSKPTAPNMIVGMVVSGEEKILENAIVTIVRQSDGTPVRALKTNMLGQFGVVTPLEKGQYIVSVEKDGYHFDNHSLVLNNQVIEPILLKANSQ